MNKRDKQALKEFSQEKIRNTLAKPGAHQFILVLDHLKPDFNVGKIFRSADAFGACEIHLVGIPFFHPGTAKGSFRHVPAKFFETFAESYANLRERGYDIYIFEPRGGIPLYQAKLGEKSAFVMGHEQFGLSFTADQFEGLKKITIPQYGKVESLNVSIAASMAMYEYTRQLHSR
ncbi:MAG TPA: TrmH family RNA methyltransferase [Bdellovibrionales bacterium]|nr:TrmH family RNA methyltransferase [Bdellovibrionales bacterium]